MHSIHRRRGGRSDIDIDHVEPLALAAGWSSSSVGRELAGLRFFGGGGPGTGGLSLDIFAALVAVVAVGRGGVGEVVSP